MPYSIERTLHPESALTTPLPAGQERFVERADGSIVHQIGNAQGEAVTVSGGNHLAHFTINAFGEVTLDGVAYTVTHGGSGVGITLPAPMQPMPAQVHCFGHVSDGVDATVFGSFGGSKLGLYTLDGTYVPLSNFGDGSSYGCVVLLP